MTPWNWRRGGASNLLAAALAAAEEWPSVIQVHLSVTEASSAAEALYRKAGFVEWDREPRALRWQDEFTDELLRVLQLDSSSIR